MNMYIQTVVEAGYMSTYVYKHVHIYVDWSNHSNEI